MDILTLSRIQFADTAAFHIIFPLMSIGLSFYMVVMEALWLYTGNEAYYRQVRFWLNIFILTFAIGVGSGFPLAFQFGTNWAAFSAAAGSFFGNILGFETTIAFTLETASLGILVFGWGKVPRVIHFLANLGVLVGASLSAFWIVVANSWMQMPRGIHMEGTKIIVDDYAAAIFNPDSIVSFAHMWVACIESTLFLMAGICAWALLRNHKDGAFFLRAFKYVLVLMIAVTPLQVVIGDMSGLIIAKHQPEKLAAAELHWDTNPAGEGAPWHVLAWPNVSGTGNAFELSVPDGLSLLLTRSTDGSVRGLNDFPADERPSTVEATLVFYAFRIMMAAGFAMLALAALGFLYWKLGRLALEKVAEHRLFWRLWVWGIPLGFLATEMGWMVREIGRQPWIMYHLMRVSDAVSSNLQPLIVGATIAAITALYLFLGALFIYFTRRIIITGPDLSSPLPSTISR